jgi:hypothetical protein
MLRNTLPVVEIFVPSGVCSCSFAVWINKVWDILAGYKDQVEVVSLTSDTDRAKELGVGGRTVVVNGDIIPVFLLQRKLSELLREISSASPVC